MWHEWTPAENYRETIEGYWPKLAPELVKAGADVVKLEKWLISMASEAHKLRVAMERFDRSRRGREFERVMQEIG